MTMDNGEIVREYRLSKNKKMMISVLAELNATDKDRIRAILKAAGEPMPHPPKFDKRGRALRPTPEQEKAIIAGIEAGKAVCDISAETGVGYDTVRHRARKLLGFEPGKRFPRRPVQK